MRKIVFIGLCIFCVSFAWTADILPDVVERELGVLSSSNNIDSIAVIGRNSDWRVVVIQDGELKCFTFNASGGPLIPGDVVNGVYPLNGYKWLRRYRLFADEWISFIVRQDESGNDQLFALSSNDSRISIFPFGRIDSSSAGLIEDFNIIGSSFRSCTLIYRKAGQIERVQLDFDKNIIRPDILSSSNEKAGNLFVQKGPIGVQIPVNGLYRLLDADGNIETRGVFFQEINGVVSKTYINLKPGLVDSFDSIRTNQSNILNITYRDESSEYQLLGTSLSGIGLLFPASQSGDAFLELVSGSGTLTLTRRNALLESTGVLLARQNVIGNWIDLNAGIIYITYDGSVHELNSFIGVDSNSVLEREIQFTGSIFGYLRAGKLDVLLENADSNIGNIHIFNGSSQTLFQTSAFAGLSRDYELLWLTPLFACVRLGSQVMFLDKEGVRGSFREGNVQVNLFSNNALGIIRNGDGIMFVEYSFRGN